MTVVLAVIAICWLPGTRIASADNSGCTSVQARCAVEAGGKCDIKTGHWCYGRSHSGEWCGGSPAAYHTCLSRNGLGEIDLPGTQATASDMGKCTSVQARCAVEAGGYCDSHTGRWRIGAIFRHMYGGNYAGFTACLDRMRAGQK
jgi:hypothetical protein